MRGVWLLALLCLVLGACSAPVGPGGGGPGGPGPAGTPTPRAQGPTPTARPGQPMPATQTSCPAISPSNPFGTRAAIMRPLQTGAQQNLVYIYNEQNGKREHGHLLRYDVHTGQKVTIVSSGVRIQEAQLSADGQWIMFLSVPDNRSDPQHVAMLQLVRSDGQGLQTLYCFPKLPYSAPVLIDSGIFPTRGDGRGEVNYPGYELPISFQWSPDERHVLLSADLKGNTSQIELLDIRTGSFRPELLRSEPCNLYIPMTWLDGSRAYIAAESRWMCGSPPGPMQLYLLNALTNLNPLDPSWTEVLSANVRFADVAATTSPDASSLFFSSCLQGVVLEDDSTVTVEPAAGGAQRTIYHLASAQEADTCLESIRAVNAQELLVLLRQGGYPTTKPPTYELALLPTNGSGKLGVFAHLPAGNDYGFNAATRFTWSNISRDGRLYALNVCLGCWGNPPLTGASSAIYYGNLSGGNPVTVAATSSGNVEIAGWTLM